MVCMVLRHQIVARELISHQEEPARHQDAVREERVTEEPGTGAPVGQADQDAGERDALADLD
jgi:hypothetical protein